MLELAEVTEDDVVYDLGSGDGRFVIAAAKEFGARGVGIEIDSQLVEQARNNARQAGVEDQVEFRQRDLFEANLHEATVVTMYLWPTMTDRLRPKLLSELSPGTRVVSHDFDIDGWAPDTTVSIGNDTLQESAIDIHFWTVPQ
jgi:ribosomal protein L11 methylase PrmA